MQLGDKSIEPRDNLIRIYPQKNLFSHIIGQIDNDNNGIFEWSSSLPALDVVQFVAISQIEGVREYCVTEFVAIQLTTHQETISKDDMKIALCDDALRLSIKDELE